MDGWAEIRTRVVQGPARSGAPSLDGLFLARMRAIAARTSASLAVRLGSPPIGDPGVGMDPNPKGMQITSTTIPQFAMPNRCVVSTPTVHRRRARASESLNARTPEAIVALAVRGRVSTTLFADPGATSKRGSTDSGFASAPAVAPAAGDDADGAAAAAKEAPVSIRGGMAAPPGISAVDRRGALSPPMDPCRSAGAGLAGATNRSCSGCTRDATRGDSGSGVPRRPNAILSTTNAIPCANNASDARPTSSTQRPPFHSAEVIRTPPPSDMRPDRSSVRTHECSDAVVLWHSTAG
jgi:hypothetical protein